MDLPLWAPNEPTSANGSISSAGSAFNVTCSGSVGGSMAVLASMLFD